MTSSLDFSRYKPPGVYTETVAGPQIGVNTAGPSAIGIFGATVGYRTDTETLTIPADTAGVANPTAYLRQKGIDIASIVVRDPITNVTYVKTANGTNFDYDVVSTTGPSGVVNGPDSTNRLKRMTVANTILPGSQVQVSYRYADTTYYDVKNFYDFDDVRDAYGPSMDASGVVVSELTLACNFAFVNGATRIITAAVKVAGSTPTTQEYVDALKKFEDQADIAIVVPATGIAELQPYILSHVNLQSLNRHERRAVVGRDGSVTPVTSDVKQTNAKALKNTRIAMVSPSTVNYFNTSLNAQQTLGGQYMAAAIAGMAVSQPPALPLTRKNVSGFNSLVDVVGEAQKDLEATAGLMVVESTNAGTLRIRHGVTTDPTNLLTREWTITGQQDAMVYQVRAYLDADGLIGGRIDDLTLANVKASASAALEALVSTKVIQGYEDLKVRQLVASPDVLEIRYAWKPSVPLNYIVVRYSISLTTGNVADVPAAV